MVGFCPQTQEDCMPLTHERTFRIRHYECDPYGHVNHARYVRYMQETAFDASEAAGYGMARYDEMGILWLVRETDITYERPLRYGDRVTVKTWVGDFRRVRSRRMYELRLADDTPVATAHTEWVLLNQATQRPTKIPPALKEAFFPEGVPPPSPRPPQFPDPPPAPPGVFEMRRRVEWRDLDPVGHVNNAAYMTFLEECGIGMAQFYGWPMARMIETGFGIVARNYRIEYLQPALMDDELELATWVSDVRRISAVRHYTIRRAAGELLVRARAHWVWVDLKNGRPIRVNPDFLRDCAPNIVS